MICYTNVCGDRQGERNTRGRTLSTVVNIYRTKWKEFVEKDKTSLQL